MVLVDQGARVLLGVDRLIFDGGLCKSPTRYRAYASG